MIFVFTGIAVVCIVVGWHLSDVQPPPPPVEPKAALPPDDDWERAALHLIDAVNEEWKERQKR